MVVAVVLVSVLGTAIMSGVLGMAGGMVLMAILVSVLTVADAMLLHGAVQATSNGSRAWFLRKYISWQILPMYIVGAFLALGGFTLLALIPHPGVILLLVGAFPWLARFNSALRGLDITRPLTTVICGFVVTSAQLLAGASGPLLDAFYVNAPMNRQEIVANKALTQTLGHLIKIVYYGFIVSVAVSLPGWLVLACLPLAILGARIGTQLLHRWNDDDFQRISQIIILTLATGCLIEGVRQLVF